MVMVGGVNIILIVVISLVGVLIIIIGSVMGVRYWRRRKEMLWRYRRMQVWNNSSANISLTSKLESLANETTEDDEFF